MTIKSDRWIRRMAQEHGMIEPFVDGQVRDGVISYGNSSYGYDMRIANEFKVFTNVFNTLVDPTLSRSLARSNFSAFRAMCWRFVSENRLMHVAV